MRILVIGSGGREHALTWTLARSRQAPDLFVAPGNPGTARWGTNVDLDTSDAGAVVRFCRDKSIDQLVVGPEKPLVEGLADEVTGAGFGVIGPSRKAARLEGSKAFAKGFMQRHRIPTARHRTFAAADYEAAQKHLDAEGAPVVVKASGLAGGKGAFVCTTREEAKQALDQIVKERRFDDAGDRVVIEAFMEGEEASVFALTDGERYVLMAPAQDHKRIGEGDTGPNTGGMGAYAPAPVMTGRLLDRVSREIIGPTLAGMAEEGVPYRGILYCGLMITDEGPKVVEYNCRLGDPEAQVVLPLMTSDLTDAFAKLAGGELDEVALHAAGKASACVVLASEGYPIEYETGKPIRGVEEAEAVEGVIVFHAGTARDDEGRLVTAGGRVLGVTAVAEALPQALDRAYQAADRIDFEGKTYRRDIGQKGLRRMPEAS